MDHMLACPLSECAECMVHGSGHLGTQRNDLTFGEDWGMSIEMHGCFAWVRKSIFG